MDKTHFTTSQCPLWTIFSVVIMYRCYDIFARADLTMLLLRLLRTIDFSLVLIHRRKYYKPVPLFLCGTVHYDLFKFNSIHFSLIDWIIFALFRAQFCLETGWLIRETFPQINSYIIYRRLDSIYELSPAVIVLVSFKGTSELQERI